MRWCVTCGRTDCGHLVRILDREVPMPRKPMVPKAVRVPDELWRAAQAKADERDEYLSEVIRKALERYVSRK